MGNIVATIKRFLSNKNTVTIIGVMLGIVVLYVGYNYRVKSAIDTIQIPYAKKTITATTEITSDMVGLTPVLRSTVTSNKTLISNVNNVVNTVTPNCVKVATSIPQGSYFYTEQVDVCSKIPVNVFQNMPDGYKPVTLPVDIQSTYGNSMYPGDYIDLYISMRDSQGLLVFGEFITKLPILDVRDSSGNSVFLTSVPSVPTALVFAVPKELYLLLSKAKLLSGISLIPVPGNASYTSEAGSTSVSSEFLRKEVEDRTLKIPDEAIPD